MKEERLQLIPHIQGIVKNYYRQLHALKYEKLREVEKFLEIYKLPKLNEEETESLNRPIIGDKIEAIIKKTPNKQRPWTRWFHRRILQSI